MTPLVMVLKVEGPLFSVISSFYVIVLDAPMTYAKALAKLCKFFLSLMPEVMQKTTKFQCVGFNSRPPVQIYVGFTRFGYCAASCDS